MKNENLTAAEILANYLAPDDLLFFEGWLAPDETGCTIGVPAAEIKKLFETVGLKPLVIKADPESDILNPAFTALFDTIPLTLLPGENGKIGAYILPGVGVALVPLWPGPIGAPAPIYLGAPA